MHKPSLCCCCKHLFALRHLEKTQTNSIWPEVEFFLGMKSELSLLLSAMAACYTLNKTVRHGKKTNNKKNSTVATLQWLAYHDHVTWAVCCPRKKTILMCLCANIELQLIESAYRPSNNLSALADGQHFLILHNLKSHLYFCILIPCIPCFLDWTRK